MKIKKPKIHVVLKTTPVLLWREYCEKNGFEYHNHLENIMEKIAVGEAVVTAIHHVKANIRGTE